MKSEISVTKFRVMDSAKGIQAASQTLVTPLSVSYPDHPISYQKHQYRLNMILN